MNADIDGALVREALEMALARGAPATASSTTPIRGGSMPTAATSGCSRPMA
jgi:hypothetical protein